MKKIFMAALALFLSTQFANAKDNSTKETSNFDDRYVSIGYVFGNTQFKDEDKIKFYEPSFNLAIGASLPATESNVGKLRVAADWTYRSFEAKDLDIDVLLNTLAANAYYDFNTGTKLTPYVNAMLGFTYAHLDLGEGADKRKVNFAYGIGVGAFFKINEKTDIDLEYRYSEMAGKINHFKIKNEDVLLSLHLHY
ncbi:MAG: outer membrane beta-barrel protein [Alphaproteobacteria bacterium]|nr:outer membrane beta-barrel protein [Alphaproteobacteria bacterium]